MRIVASILWRRLDAPGRDACRLVRDAAGWVLDGAAAFRCADGRLARLAYRVRCGPDWRTRQGAVRGWLGDRRIDLALARDADGWSCGGVRAPGLSRCPDLDLGFTPATNLPPMRRLGSAPGAPADAPAAWLDLEGGAPGLVELPQRYRRVGRDACRYEDPSLGYAATLRTTAAGFVRDYPGLWVEDAGDAGDARHGARGGRAARAAGPGRG